MVLKVLRSFVENGLVEEDDSFNGDRNAKPYRLTATGHRQLQFIGALKELFAKEKTAVLLPEELVEKVELKGFCKKDLEVAQKAGLISERKRNDLTPREFAPGDVFAHAFPASDKVTYELD